MKLKGGEIYYGVKEILVFLIGQVIKTGYNSPYRIAILTYHDIPLDKNKDVFGVPFENFLFHLSLLGNDSLKSFSILRSIKEFESFFDYLEDRRNFKVKVALSFDDGFKSFLNVMPFINDLRILTFLFITPKFINSSNKYLTWDEVRFLKNAMGDRLIIGSHGLTHKPLHSIGAKDVKEELYSSKSIIEQQLNVEVHFLAYPYGYNVPDFIVEMAYEVGYKYAFTNKYGFVCVGDNKLKLRRIPILKWDTPWTLKQKINGDFNPHLLYSLLKEKQSLHLK